jgi:hypothetical protein
MLHVESGRKSQVRSFLLALPCCGKFVSSLFVVEGSLGADCFTLDASALHAVSLFEAAREVSASYARKIS